VKCDPRHKKAKFDAAASRAQARAQHDQLVEAQSAQFDAIAASAPGATVAAADGSLLGAPGVSVVNLSGVDISGVLPEIQQALASGNLADLARIKAELRQQAHPDAGTSSDPVERLEKLAKLHASGALTDAEFAAAKAKLLSES